MIFLKRLMSIAFQRHYLVMSNMRIIYKGNMSNTFDTIGFALYHSNGGWHDVVVDVIAVVQSFHCFVLKYLQ
jgi:hypothetical protein